MEIRLGPGTKKEAQAKEREVLRRVENEPATDAKRVTVSDLLTTWLTHIAPTAKAQPVCPKTHERYSSIVRNQLVPQLGSILLSRLMPEQITQMQTNLREAGLAAQTCLHAHRVLHAALNFGVRNLRLLRENPASCVKAPKVAARRIQVSEDQVVSMIQATVGTRLEVPLRVAAMTGLRRGELLALRWENIDFETSRLIVLESLEETKDFGIRFKSPKTGRPRVIPLAAALARILKEHRAKQNAERGRLGLSYDDQRLVFCNEDGSPWRPDCLTHQFGIVAKRIGMKGFRLHDMRHSFASISLKQGTSVKEIAELLGHSSPMLTLSTYAHAMEGAAKEAVNKLADLLIAYETKTGSVRKCEKMGSG